MARPGASLNTRIAKLQAALDRAKKLKRGTVLAARPMAELLGVSWVTLREWCDEFSELETSGAVMRGGNGIEWSFAPARTISVILKMLDKRLAGQAKKSREITSAIGVAMPTAEEASSISETKDLVNLTLAVVAAAEKQRRYTPTEEMIEFVDRYNQRVVDGIMGVRTRVDPNGNLPPHVRAAMDNYLRMVATEVHGEASRFIEDHRARLQQAGTF